MKKACLLLSLAVVPAILGFTPPSKEESEKSIGSTASLVDPLRRAFAYNDDFKPIPEPGFSDWLSSREEPGQTYTQFLASRPNKPGAEGRKFIYLQPIGNFPESAPKIDTLKKYLEAYFHPMEVKLADSVDLQNNARVGRREKFGEIQLNCVDLLDQLQARVPRDAYVVMGVTMSDLFPGPEWNFVFGMARIKNRVGVFSFARYGNEPKLALKRAMKVISHETGHAFGIRHCTHFHCLMNGSNGMNETDRAPLHVCPSCLRKLYWGLQFDPALRYQKLAEFLTQEGMPEAAWFQDRTAMIRR